MQIEILLLLRFESEEFGSNADQISKIWIIDEEMAKWNDSNDIRQNKDGRLLLWLSSSP